MPAGGHRLPRVADSASLDKRWSRRDSFNLLAAESQPGESLRTTNICIKGSGLITGTSWAFASIVQFRIRTFCSGRHQERKRLTAACSSIPTRFPRHEAPTTLLNIFAKSFLLFYRNEITAWNFLSFPCFVLLLDHQRQLKFCRHMTFRGVKVRRI